MFNKIKRNFLLVLIFAILIYLGLLLIADSEKTISNLKEFPLNIFLQALFLIFISILFKFARWQIFINEVKIRITFIDSILVFMSGLIMSISPGKVGELLKSFLLKSAYSIPIIKSAPIIAAERVVEFIALTIICLTGIFVYSYGLVYLLLLVPFLLIVFGFFVSKKIRNLSHKLFTRMPFLKNNINSIENFNYNFGKLFTIKVFPKTLIVSFLAWFAEYYGFYLVLKEFQHDISIIWSSFAYSFSMIIGAISMLPGGIGTTEGSLAYILTNNGFFESAAFATTVIIRFLTLWIPVLIGFIAVVVFSQKKDIKI